MGQVYQSSESSKFWAQALLRALRSGLMVLAGAAYLLLGLAPQAWAQQANGTLGWQDTAGTKLYYGSPEEACQAQFQHFQSGKPNSRYIGYEDTGIWFRKGCKWTTRQYLCQEETGGNSTLCGTALPSSVEFKCASGYTPIEPGQCVKTPIPERPCPCDNNGGSPNPQVGYPITLRTGAKKLSGTDFATDDGRFVISRSFSSMSGVLITSAENSVRQPIAGLDGNWNFDFAYELQFGDFSGTITGPIVRVSVRTPGGPVHNFYLKANDTSGYFTPRADLGPSYLTTELKLKFLGTYPTYFNTIPAAPSDWELTDGDDTVWVLRTFKQWNSTQYAIGRPISRTWRDGYRWDFVYDADGALSSITDSFGRTATFAWRKYHYSILPTPPANALPKPEAIERITLPDQTSLLYTFDPPASGSPGANGENGTPSLGMIKRLTKAERFDVAQTTVLDSTTYLYEDQTFPRFPNGVLDNRGNRVRSYIYTAEEGRALSTEAWNGTGRHTVTYSSDSTNKYSVVTGPLGKVETYRFQRFGNSNDYRLISITGAATANTPATTSTISHFTSSTTPFVSSQTDDLGRTTTYTRDLKGRPTVITEANGTAIARTTSFAYDPALNLPATITRPGLTESRTYSGGNLTGVTLTDTTTITAPIATNGRTRTTTYDWGPQGQLLSVNGPLPGNADTVSMTYDAQGQLATTTNPLGHTAQVLSRNALGRPLAVRDANGVDTAFTYDAMGRVLTVTHDPGPAQSLYSMEYDAGGNMTKLTLPMGGWLAYTYDGANRVTRVENQRGEAMAYTLNAVGAPTAETTSAAGGAVVRSASKAYDELGRLIRSVGANGETWQFHYDLAGNPVKTTDARGKEWSDTLDPLDRPVTATNPELQAENTVYRADDAVTQFRDARNLATDWVVDGFGLTLQQTSPDTGVTQYRYDEAARLIQSTDADGVQSDYTYDAAGRLLTEVSAKAGLATQTVTYGYDSVAGGNKGVGRLTSVTDPSGAAAYTYDAQGRVTQSVKTIGAQTYLFANAWDANGEVTALTYPSGRVVEYTRDGDGQVTGVSVRASAAAAPVPLASGITWRPFGPLSGLTYGNGLTLARGHDGNDWLGAITLTGSSGALIDLAFTRDANGNVTAVTDQLGAARDAAYGYSDAGRLTAASGIWGADAYQWDANSNRTRADRTTSAGTFSDVATIAAASNRLTELRDGAGVLAKSFAFTPGGDTASVTPASGPVQTYAYDARGRLASVSLGGTVQASYAYDYTGQRVVRSVAGASVHYLFDAAGHLLAEHDGASGQVVREYVWLGDTLLAVGTGPAAAPQWSFVTTGNLGEPLMVTDAAGAITSSLTRDPWGNPILLAAGTPLELGYPGQWQDSASGLWQNWMRDYDPALGRYAEADPIGLGGGSNLYAYVGGDPVNRVDPMGLFAPAVVPVVCAAGVCEAVGSGLAALVGLVTILKEESCEDKCEKAKADARRRYWKLVNKRIPQYTSGGTRGPDPKHYDSLLALQRALKDAIRRVRLYCRPWPAELPEWERVANLPITPWH